MDMTQLTRGCQETKDLLAAVFNCQATHHATLKQKGMTQIKVLNEYRASVTSLLTKLQAAELAETDSMVRGRFEELASALRAADRLSSEAATAVSKSLNHCARCEAITAEIVALASKPVEVAPST